mgnify:CR=1 FL=1
MYFTGKSHPLILKPQSSKIINLTGEFGFHLNEAVAVNNSGEILKVSGKPAFNGDTLIKISEYIMSQD